MTRRNTALLALLVWLVAATAMAERLTVTAAVANIRTGPGTGYDVGWKVERYHPIRVVEKRGVWYRFVDYAGDSAWVHRSLLGKVPAVITRKKLCNIRTGPGQNNAVSQTIEDGIPFKLLRKKGRWLHIEHADGDRGWIHNSLVW